MCHCRYSDDEVHSTDATHAWLAGLVFVGGFSYADVLDSAKGWAGTIRHNARLWEDFTAFYQRCRHNFFFIILWGCHAAVTDVRCLLTKPRIALHACRKSRLTPLDMSLGILLSHVDRLHPRTVCILGPTPAA